MNNPRGSVWNKWDLHVHTPDSIHSEYPGTKEEAWERFILELERLPAEFKVIGINDYLFIDGYRRILEEKANDRLKNIELFLPVIEMRLDKFGGTESSLSKVNFHVIFSDELDPDTIESQFLNALYSGYSLSPEYEALKPDWKAVPTKASLTDLGQLIIDSVPEEKKSQFGPALVEGFNNITFKLDEINRILKSTYFRGKCLTAVGKTEWWDIKWNDQSIADKKNVINSVHFVFISSKSVNDCLKAHDSLTNAGVNNRLLDCSDAHRFSDASYKDRIGKCFTWIKSDPTFRGLSMALYEPESRISLSNSPPKFDEVTNNKTKYIRAIEINKLAGSSLAEDWYEDINLELNHDMVAIIGNKGMGKSALSEVIGLLGNTKNDDHFSFLCPQRFRAPLNNKAAHFEASLTWESGDVESASLDAKTDHNTDEKVKYIPQGFFDDVCNEIVSGEETNFDKEIKKVIFSHVELPDTLGTSSLDELISFKTEQTYDAIRILQSQIEEVNVRVLALEEKLDPDYRLALQSALDQKKRELEAHDSSKPIEIEKPENQLGPEMKALAVEIEKAHSGRSTLIEELSIFRGDEERQALLISVAKRALEKIDNFKSTFALFKSDLSVDLEILRLVFEDIVKLEVGSKPIEDLQSNATTQRSVAAGQADLTVGDSHASKLADLNVHLRDLQAKLDEPTRKHQEFLEVLRTWEEMRATIIGSTDIIGSFEYYSKQLSNLSDLPEILVNEKQIRTKLVLEIHQCISKLADTYKDIYQPVQDFIETYPIAQDVFHLEFGVSIINVDFQKKIFDWIGRNVVGSFYGSVEGQKKVTELLGRYDFNDESGLAEFLEAVMDHLCFDRRDPGNPQPVKVSDQLKKDRTVLSLYNYIFSLEYLVPRFVLKLGDKELSQLSPGERGILLLTFYLLVDKDNMPLIIDQPEENLDNQTLYEFLVKCMKDAKDRRQIIIVTHNPNLAVVCDSEQVIWSSIDKVNNNRIDYQSGSIENPLINDKIIDILEGTKPAFDNRKLKYQPPILAVD